jgi:hypothetical protein
MRYYTTKMMSGITTFKCVYCKHSVTTREFKRQNGNCRSQAARAMNEHAMVAHGCVNFMSPANTQMWHAQTTHFTGRNERQSDMVPEPDAHATHQQNARSVDHALSLSKGI